ncbi:hypothetical protein ACH4E7_10140 [Kitasatospora sp. NPDC018058]|uniref:hypothetical protein n=1 Tax=Kitasatospora sp. NPDC018058 TaxID=3364025 RepID=UPI0037BF380E
MARNQPIARRDPLFASLGHARHAAIHGLTGDTNAVRRSLGRAQDALDRADLSTSRPLWTTAFYDQSELDSLALAAYLSADSWEEAEAHAHRSMALRRGAMQRSRAITTVRLAHAQLGQGDLEPAVATAMSVPAEVSTNPRITGMLSVPPSGRLSVNDWMLKVTSEPRRSYSSGTVAGLLTLARGGCYWPDCGEPTIRMVDGEPVQNLQIAHIRAFEENGPRFDPTWSPDERNQFSNLILLCTPHHKVIDGPRSAEFPVKLLIHWKNAREADGLDALEGLGDLTKADLGEMIAEAQTELLDRLGPALDEFAKTAPDLASLLRLVTSELADPRVQAPGSVRDLGLTSPSTASSLPRPRPRSPP